MELRINAYMAIYYIHPEIKSSITDEDLVLDVTAERLAIFKQFLDQSGGDFAEDMFAPYFSLPYVLSVDTDQNDDIKLIFEKKWLTDLEEDLLLTIDVMCTRCLLKLRVWQRKETTRPSCKS
jgi:hypothetical protein